MTNLIDKLVRPNIRKLTPYSSARSLFTSGILLDANENPNNLFGAECDLNRYPDTRYLKLREKAAELYGVRIESCAAGSGSDELLDLLLRIFCEPGQDEIILSNPTYGNYEVLAAIHDVNAIDVPLTPDFQLDPGGILNRATGKTKLIFVCSPNNPTGNAFRGENILEIAAGSNAILVLDEAYAEFMTGPSLIPEIGAHGNLVVLRTLSKAYAMAGVRIGFALANPEIIEYIQKIKLPYNISILAAEQAVRAMENRETVEKEVALLLEEREKMAARLERISGVEKVYPSDANFILFKVRKAEEIFMALARKGIIVRSRARDARLENCLRVTVGTPEENELFFQSLGEITAALSI